MRFSSGNKFFFSHIFNWLFQLSLDWPTKPQNIRIDVKYRLKKLNFWTLKGECLKRMREKLAHSSILPLNTTQRMKMRFFLRNTQSCWPDFSPNGFVSSSNYIGDLGARKVQEKNKTWRSILNHLWQRQWWCWFLTVFTIGKSWNHLNE